MAGGWAPDGAEQQQIDDSLNDALQYARAALPQGRSARECVECGEPIPEARRRALPGVQSATAFGSRLHVAGQDAALLQQAVAPLAQRPGLRVAPAEASLEDVFISLIGQAQDNFGGGAQPS